MVTTWSKQVSPKVWASDGSNDLLNQYFWAIMRVCQVAAFSTIIRSFFFYRHTLKKLCFSNISAFMLTLTVICSQKWYQIYIEIYKVLSVLVAKCHFIWTSPTHLSKIYIQHLQRASFINHHLISAEINKNNLGKVTFSIHFTVSKR